MAEFIFSITLGLYGDIEPFKSAVALYPFYL